MFHYVVVLLLVILAPKPSSSYSLTLTTGGMDLFIR